MADSPFAAFGAPEPPRPPRKSDMTRKDWYRAGSFFTALLFASLALGFAIGMPSGIKAKPKQTVALKDAKPKAKPPEPEAKKDDKKDDPTPEPKKADPKKVEPKKMTEPKMEPEPKKKEPEPEAKKDPEPEPKKKDPEPEPKKKEPEPKKVEPKKVEPKVEPKGAVVTFAKVEPIFKAKCNVCHGDPSKKAGLDFRTVASILKGNKNGPGIVPGKPGDSSIWASVADNSMPPSDSDKEPLTDQEKKLLMDWILGGAKEK